MKKIKHVILDAEDLLKLEDLLVEYQYKIGFGYKDTQYKKELFTFLESMLEE